MKLFTPITTLILALSFSVVAQAKPIDQKFNMAGEKQTKEQITTATSTEAKSLSDLEPAAGGNIKEDATKGRHQFKTH